MQYQIYVPLPSLISVDGTGLPYPRLAHMACDHSVQKIKKENKILNLPLFKILIRVMFQLLSSTFQMTTQCTWYSSCTLRDKQKKY